MSPSTGSIATRARQAKSLPVWFHNAARIVTLVECLPMLSHDTHGFRRQAPAGFITTILRRTSTTSHRAPPHVSDLTLTTCLAYRPITPVATVLPASLRVAKTLTPIFSVCVAIAPYPIVFTRFDLGRTLLHASRRPPLFHYTLQPTQNTYSTCSADLWESRTCRFPLRDRLLPDYLPRRKN